MKRSFLVVLAVLLACNLAMAADYIRFDKDAITPGATETLDFYVTRQCPTPTLIQGASNGFVMTSTGSVTWTYNSLIKYHDMDWWNLGGLLFNNLIIQ